MEEMKDLLDTHSSLSVWLSAKERMMTALGPISSDSRMVQTQVQQVYKYYSLCSTDFKSKGSFLRWYAVGICKIGHGFVTQTRELMTFIKILK